MPDCAATHLTFDADDDVWQGTFNVPAGDWEYKAPLNDSWDENYGANAVRNGGNIASNLAAAAAVKFYYSHETHWITSNRNAVIAVAPGSFQRELGCAGRLAARTACAPGSRIRTATASTPSRPARLPAGSYEAKVAINESWDENYGAGGAPDGANIPFTVAADCAETVFSYNAATHVLTVVGGSGGGAAQPASVTIAGSLQSELGCPDDWQPACANTHLAFDADGRRLAGDLQRPGRELGVQGAPQRLLGRELRRQRPAQRRQHPPQPRLAGGGQVLLRSRAPTG